MSAPHIPGLTDLRPLGQGGFATVYRAHQAQLGRDVAVKVSDRVLGNERDRRRFLREAHAAGRLSNHPNVVTVHDSGITADGRPYLVMELCAGTLSDQLDKDGRFPPDRVRDIGIHLADALATAHAEGILHRDIKPGNVLVDSFGTVKLADFGLAAILDAQSNVTASRDALSPNYAAPEAFAMAAPTVAADVYALAATLYTLLSGRPPREVPWPVNSLDQLATILRTPIAPVPGASPALTATLTRALEPDASQRTRSATQLRDELRGHQEQKPRRKPWLAVAAVVLVLAGLGIGWVLLNSSDVRTKAGPGGGGSSTGSVFTGEAQQETAPPYLEACATGYCVAEPLCYAGINEVGGEAAASRRLDCADEHRWEAFAGGWLSGDIPKVSSSDLARAPEVSGVCTPAAMKAMTRPQVDTTGWEIVAIAKKDGDRTYFHCLAMPEEGGVFTTSAFGK